MRTGDQVGQHHGSTSVDAHVAVHKHLPLLFLSLVDEGAGAVEVHAYVVVLLVFGRDSQVGSEASLLRVWVLQWVDSTLGRSAVEDVGDAQTVQILQIVCVFLVANKEVIGELRDMGGKGLAGWGGVGK